MQHVLVFQRDGLGGGKVAAIREFGEDMELTVIDVTGPFLPIIDEPENCFPANMEDLLTWADLVLDHLYHPDLTGYLLDLAEPRGKKVVISGRKLTRGITPQTCCTLGRLEGLGAYGEHFGAPEFSVQLDDEGKVSDVTVLRGAPCGATWEAARAVIGLTPEEARTKIGLSTQFHCFAKANPNVFLTNPLHVAGDVHAAALGKALKTAAKKAQTDPT